MKSMLQIIAGLEEKQVKGTITMNEQAALIRLIAIAERLYN